MAKYTTFPEANGLLRAPRGMEGEVGDLPVHGHYGPGGSVNATSCWRLTPEEMSEVKRTGVVWLTVIGGHPPVRIMGTKPPEVK